MKKHTVMNNIKLAIIDHDQQLRNNLSGFFTSHNNTFRRVFTFNSIDTYLSDAYMFPDLHAVIVNTALPAGLTCDEGIQYMKQLTAQAKIILLDGIGNRNDVFRLLCKGASAYVDAASSFESIKEAVVSTLCSKDASASEMLLYKSGNEEKKTQSGGKIHQLTTREQEVVERIMLGEGKKTIAANLSISERLVKRYLLNAYHKVQISGNIQLNTGYRKVG
jgi:DNA-binding NarL/FixJ family response regulator